MNYINKMVATFFSLGIVISPFYLWSSGLPQVADFIFLIFNFLVFYCVRRTEFTYQAKMLVKLLSIFVLYITIINLIWAMIWGSYKPILYSLFYIYDFLLFFSIVMLGRNVFECKIISLSFPVSMIFLCLLFPIFFDSSLSRQSLTFNNPNQLGAFALFTCAICCIFYEVNNEKSFNRTWFIVGFLSALFLIFLSMSVSAILSVVLLILIFSIRNFTKIKLITYSFGLVSIVVLSFSIFSLIDDNYITDTIKTRVERKESVAQSHSFLEERGYDRIYNYTDYLIFGHGEGEMEKYESFAAEVHSIFGTVIFSYGFVGTIIYLTILIYLNFQFKLSLYLWPIYLYGSTHQSLRDPLYWVAMAFICLAFSFEKKKK